MRIAKFSILAITFGLLFLSTELLVAVRSNQSVFGSKPDLEKIINYHGDSWTSVGVQILDPRWKNALANAYDEVVSHTMQRKDGQAVAVVMTWSRDGIRRPGHVQQICYQSSGCAVTSPHTLLLQTAAGVQSLVVFTARRENIVEDVAYWRVTGGTLDRPIGDNYLASHRLDMFIRFIRLMLGEIPDNYMVRVSTVRVDHDQPASVHLDYIKDFLEAIPLADRQRIMGK
jgi:hypothetical protein